MHVHVPDVPAPSRKLCWKQAPNMVRCDRKRGHGGLHSWEIVAEINRLREKIAELLKESA